LIPSYLVALVGVGLVLRRGHLASHRESLP